MLVSIIQSWSLLAFNGLSANVLSGQRGPRARSHFNGCHDERVKSEQGDSVSLIGEKKVGGHGRGERRQGWGEGHRRRAQMAFLDRYVSSGVMERNRKKREERGTEIGLLVPLFATGYKSIILKMMR